uniref:Homeobox domain-containing protein n=1 Tax=Oryzias latipes TaxID=8090 RepID=A0A3B3HIY9_ORYLA
MELEELQHQLAVRTDWISVRYQNRHCLAPSWTNRGPDGWLPGAWAGSPLVVLTRTWGLGGKTRTKDKHGVVYTDHQRLKLEKEFQYNRYIIKRAKERKMTRKKLQHSQQASTTTPTPPVLGGHADAHAAPSHSSNMVSDIKSEEY